MSRNTNCDRHIPGIYIYMRLDSNTQRDFCSVISRIILAKQDKITTQATKESRVFFLHATKVIIYYSRRTLGNLISCYVLKRFD